MDTSSSSNLYRYTVAVLIVALATLVRILLDPILHNSKTLVTYLPTIMIVAWYCGSGPTLLATFLSCAGSMFLFQEPRWEYSLALHSSQDQVSLIIFLTFGLTAVFFSEQLHRANERSAWRQRQLENERALLASERRFRQLADAMPQMVWSKDAMGAPNYCNERWYEYTGLPREPAGADWLAAIHPEDVPAFATAWREAFEFGHAFQAEYRLKDCRSGEYRWHLGRAEPARDQDGKIVQWYGTSTDIDDRKRIEVKLLEAHNELEKRVKARTFELTLANSNLSREVEERRTAEAHARMLAAQLASAEDTERRRLATDLHDSIGQHLSLLKINLESMAQRLGQNPSSQADLDNTVRLLDNIIKQARTLMFDLYPSMLTDLGLVPTLSWYCEQLGAQTQVSISELGQPQPLPGPMSIYLYRASKELLCNAVRHGRAQDIVVTVHWRRDALKLVVDDDGCGFDPATDLAPQTQHGLGLAGIQERLLAFCGKMFIESKPGQGTRIAMEVPLASPATDRVA